MTMFSFHPVEHNTTGEGGIIMVEEEAGVKKWMMYNN
jgi:dTDP-4-amino-4,6-dideoxygalactose transaminase